MTSIFTAGSFESVWYWVLSGVAWLQVCHRILGVPSDIIRRAGREPRAEARMQALAEAAIDRMAAMNGPAGMLLAAVAAFALTALFIVGFGYDAELGQAAFILFFPLTGVWLGTLRLALSLQRNGLGGAALRDALSRRRLWNQVIAAMSLLTAWMLALANHPEWILR